LTAEDRFLIRIGKLRRIIVRRTVSQTVVTAFLISLALNSPAVGVKEFGLYDFGGISVYALLTLAAIALSLLITYRTQKDLMEELIEIDARLGFKERISTAYECQGLGRRSIFVDLLFDDVSRLLDSTAISRIFPKTFSPAQLLVSILSLILISLLLFDFSPSGSALSASEAKRLAQISAKLDQYSRKKMQKGPLGEEQPQEDLYRRMEQMSEKLRDRAMDKRELLESLDDLIKEINSESARMARSLAADLSLGDASNTPMLEKLKDENLNREELEKVKKKLEELFGGKIPRAVSREMASLDQSLEFKELFEEAEEDAASALSEGETESSTGEEVLVARKSEDTDQSDRQPPKNDKTPSDSQADDESTRQQDDGPPVSGQPGPDDESAGEERGPEDDNPFTAGHGPGGGKKQAPSELETSKTPAFQESGPSGPGERFNVYVRSLPKVGQAELGEETIMRTYSQRVEEVIQREDIPINFREFIKNYFLSIGLRKKDLGTDGSN